jgi:hypothetical protein
LAALINQKIVRVDDSIGLAKVVEINPQEVILQGSDGIKKLTLNGIKKISAEGKQNESD